MFEYLALIFGYQALLIFVLIFFIAAYLTRTFKKTAEVTR